jgi:hypothetical protein
MLELLAWQPDRLAVLRFERGPRRLEIPLSTVLGPRA